MDPSTLEPRLRALYDAACAVAQNSYAPYSQFHVGAALLLDNGEVVTGTNVENCSYGLTICAERSALVRAVAQHGPRFRVKAVAIANLNRKSCPPCGACRQMLAEFTSPDAPVVFPASDGVSTMAFAEIMPLAFDLERK